MSAVARSTNVPVIDSKGRVLRRIDIDINTDVVLMRDSEGVMRTFRYVWSKYGYVENPS